MSAGWSSYREAWPEATPGTDIRVALDGYNAMRKDKGAKPLATASWVRWRERYERHGEELFIIALNESVDRGWLGLKWTIDNYKWRQQTKHDLMTGEKFSALGWDKVIAERGR